MHYLTYTPTVTMAKRNRIHHGCFYYVCKSVIQLNELQIKMTLSNYFKISSRQGSSCYFSIWLKVKDEIIGIQSKNF